MDKTKHNVQKSNSFKWYNIPSINEMDSGTQNDLYVDAPSNPAPTLFASPASFRSQAEPEEQRVSDFLVHPHR